MSAYFVVVRNKWCIVHILLINVLFVAGTNQAIGDFLVLSGAILYGVSNVAEEFVVKTFNKVEFLGMIGMFGSIISGIQVYVHITKLY